MQNYMKNPPASTLFLEIDAHPDCLILFDRDTNNSICTLESRYAIDDEDTRISEEETLERAVYIRKCVNSHNSILEALDFIFHQAYDDETKEDDIRAMFDQMREKAGVALKQVETL